mmetsp:Transcript_62448/g.115980  ORF Transcript_62448/g.115980 Transcript_62448/m.115980 type:complete len:436 (+) Transcript_62448:59-1366(+)
MVAIISVSKLILVLCLQHALQIQGKRVQGSVAIGGTTEQSRWQYLSKFGFGLGTGKYYVRARLRQPEAQQSDPLALSKFQLDVRVYLDEDFEVLDEDQLCATSFSRRSHPVWLNANGAWSEWQEGLVGQVVRPHIWYFALTDCRRSRLGNATRDVDFEFVARQPSESHFSYEMMWMPSACFVAFVGLSIFLAWFIGKCRDFQQSAGSLHPVIWVLASAVILQYASQLFHGLHLWIYAGNGEGSQAADTLAETFFMLSQVLQTTLLIGIASGYTLVPQMTCSMDLLKWTVAVVCVLHVLLVGGGKLQGEHANKHHEYEGCVGVLLLVFRLALFAWFISSLRRCRAMGGIRLEAFLQRFACAGSIYFLAYPCLCLVTQVFAPYLRRPLLQVGLTAMQAASSAWLATLFLSRGDYFKASVLSASQLPGGSTASYSKLM